MSWDLEALPSREPEPQRVAVGLPRPGSRVGPFVVLGELARGGIGAVLRVREEETGRELALKLLLAAELTPARRERFLREGQVAASLDHPGIVKVHACGEHEGRPWLACALVEGGRTLEDELARRDLAGRVGLVRDAARALGHAHARGVIHRDVKPRNILIDPAGQVRVADFGLAHASGPERLTRTGELLGTPSHMAPEQVVSAKGSESPRLDVWALGVILYQALTGELPFQGQTVLEVIAAVTRAAPAPPRELAPEVSAALEQVCLRALEKDPARRHADGEALAADLDLALAGRVPPRPARTRSAPLLLGTLTVLLLLLLAWAAGPREAGEAPGSPPIPQETPDAGVAGIESLLQAGRFPEARAACGGGPSLRRLRGWSALLAGDLISAREDLRATPDVLAIDLERDRLALAARYAQVGKQDVPLASSIRDEALALLAAAERGLSSTGIPERLLGERVLSTLCLLTAIQTVLFDKDGEQREHAALLERALRTLPARPEVAREVNLTRAWSLYTVDAVKAPLGELVAEPGPWLSRLPRTPWLDPTFTAHGLWFIAGGPDRLEARLRSAEVALAHRPAQGNDALQLLRDVLTRLSRVERARAHAAFTAGDRAAGEALRQRAIEHAQAGATAVAGDRADDWDVAQLVLAHLLGRDVDAARSVLREMEAGPPRWLLEAECELVEGDVPDALQGLDRAIAADDSWLEARLARAHARDLVRDVTGRREDMTRARELAEQSGGRSLGIDWHVMERMRPLFNHAWWPGAR